jgi:hypothetical protein
MISFGPKIPSLYVSAAQGDNYYTVGEALLRALQTLLQANVISVVLSTPPSSPNNGNTYVVGTSPTGVWAGQADNLAYWSTDNPTAPSGEWEFYSPLAGWIVGNQANGQAYIYTGSTWVQIGPSTSFANLTSGVNNSADMTVASGGVLTFSGSGQINANAISGIVSNGAAPSTGMILAAVSPTTMGWVSPTFATLTSGVNTSATMTVGPGAKLTFSGAGSPPSEGEVNANFLYGIQINSTAPTAGQILTAVSSTVAGWVNAAQDIPFYQPGTYTANQQLLRISLTRAATYPAGLTGSLATCDVAPTGSVQITIYKGTATSLGSAVGTINFAASSQVGTFTLASPLSINGTSDVLYFVAPSSPDATFAGASATLHGSRSN